MKPALTCDEGRSLLGRVGRGLVHDHYQVPARMFPQQLLEELSITSAEVIRLS